MNSDRTVTDPLVYGCVCVSFCDKVVDSSAMKVFSAHFEQLTYCTQTHFALNTVDRLVAVRKLNKCLLYSHKQLRFSDSQQLALCSRHCE